MSYFRQSCLTFFGILTRALSGAQEKVDSLQELCRRTAGPPFRASRHDSVAHPFAPLLFAKSPDAMIHPCDSCALRSASLRALCEPPREGRVRARPAALMKEYPLVLSREIGRSGDGALRSPAILSCLQSDRLLFSIFRSYSFHSSAAAPDKKSERSPNF